MHPEVAAEVVVDAVAHPVCLRGGDVDFLVGDEFGFRLQNLLKQRNVETVLLVGEQKNRAGDEQDRYDGADDDPFFQEGWF